MPHIHDLYDFTASAYIVYKNKVLLLKHIAFHSWLQPGGHIELDEHPEQTLWREIEEETSLTKRDLVLRSTQPALPSSKDALNLPVPFDINVHPVKDKHHHIDMAYLMEAKTDEVAPNNKRDTAELKWFSKTDLQKIRKEMFENVYVRCLFALDWVENAAKK